MVAEGIGGQALGAVARRRRATLLVYIYVYVYIYQKVAYLPSPAATFSLFDQA